MTPIISIIGRSGSGKTTLIEKLIPEFKKRGYRIGTIKHARCGFDIDKKGKDSSRHKNAGAEIVVIASSSKLAMVKDINKNTLFCPENFFQDMDLVLSEGFKNEKRPKIEVYRSLLKEKFISINDNNLIAVVTDVKTGFNVPLFGFEEIKSLTDFIEKKFLSKKDKN